MANEWSICHDRDKGDDKPVEPEGKLDAPEELPPDYGKCPNCSCTLWEVTEGGVFCVKCTHRADTT